MATHTRGDTLLIRLNKGFYWQKYLLDSLLAIAGPLFVTGAIWVFQLYPLIPNISIVYLLIVLPLASLRGRYAAILASVVAFLSFNYFLVPPLYVFTIARAEEWIALFVFLVTAILTSQLAVALRNRAQQARRRERETRVLYQLVRVTNRETDPKQQLEVIARTVVDVFSRWGVLDCAILQPENTRGLIVQASAYEPIEQITLSADEQATATWVVEHGRSMDLCEDATSASPRRFVQRVVVRSTTVGRAVPCSLRFVPLKLGQKVKGVLRLRMEETAQYFPQEEVGEEGSRAGEQTSFFWTFLNQVTALVERARLQQENVRIEVLQRTDALRAALLSSVSHDLRTPLTSIKAAASSLLQRDVQWDEEARTGFAQTIEHEADRLNRLVGNLLDMSRIEDGALKPEKEQYSLVALVHDVLGRLEPLFPNRSIRTHLPKEDLLLVDVDYLHMDQVLTNLIENAVRYTPPESSIDLSAWREDEKIMLTVADRGPGVPPGDLERIFDKFYRVISGKQKTQIPMGSGLGLAVCKGLVEANGGQIWAELREGGGLIIFVTLPAIPQERIEQ